MAFEVILAPAAQRQLSDQRGPALVALRGIIRSLGAEPHPPGVGKVVGARDMWRLRARIDGVPWRIVYQIRQREHIVVVLRVARRTESTYRRLG